MAAETIVVSGVRCERCIGRLAGALRTHEGIEYANANLMGEVALEWDDARTSSRRDRRHVGPVRLPGTGAGAGIASVDGSFRHLYRSAVRYADE